MAHWRQRSDRTPKTKHEKEKCFMFWKGAFAGIAIGVAVTVTSVCIAWVYIVVTQPVDAAVQRENEQ